MKGTKAQRRLLKAAEALQNAAEFFVAAAGGTEVAVIEATNLLEAAAWDFAVASIRVVQDARHEGL